MENVIRIRHKKTSAGGFTEELVKQLQHELQAARDIFWAVRRVTLGRMEE